VTTDTAICSPSLHRVVRGVVLPGAVRPGACPGSCRMPR
jgi:hypothetical protein